MPRPDTNARIDLSEQGNLERFSRLIGKAGLQLAKDPGFFTEFDLRFVKDMIYRFDNERPIWSPTRKQYNHLHTLVSSL